MAVKDAAKSTHRIEVGGRTIVFDVIGRLGGPAVFFFHGTPMSRFSASLFFPDELVSSVGVTMISADRPGCGESTFDPRRTIAGWPGDVVAIARFLHLDRFSILAYSGGAPYALATAAALGGRVTRTLVVSGNGPSDVPHLVGGVGLGERIFDLITLRPQLGRRALRPVAELARRAPDRTGRLAALAATPPDRNVLESAELRVRMAQALSAAQANGARGVALDSRLVARRWNLEGAPSGDWVVWHGAADRTVGVLMARWLADRSPTGCLEIFPNEGHLSLLVRHAARALALLVTPPAEPS
jgi:pimeloyl-ACP methyl ester carboxylesterase